MIKNYLKLTFRNLFREKLYSGINIFCLSLGAAVAILMFLYVKDEWTFDTFHAQHDRISVNPAVILLAVLTAILIAWLAVSYQSIRVARRNPVEALRYE